MTNKTQNIADTSPEALAAAYTALLAFMDDPVISIRAGKDSKHINMCDLRKVHPRVGLELLRQGAIKPLTDISRDKAKDETDTDLHRRRQEKIANWYNGDFTVRGGGTPDPVGRQMKEEIIAVYRKNGADLNSAEGKEMIKGTAAQILARVYGDGTEEFKAAMEHFRKLAAETIKERSTAKVDVKSIKLF